MRSQSWPSFWPTAPPQDDSDVMQLLAPLFQQRRQEAAELFPVLFGALAHPSVAAPVLDLANFLDARKGRAAASGGGSRCPARGPPRRSRAVAAIASGAGGRRGGIARRAEPPGGPRRGARRLAVRCAGADWRSELAIPQAPPGARKSAIAASAPKPPPPWPGWAKKPVKTQLIQLAAEPVARLRVLAYAEELGLLEQDRAAVRRRRRRGPKRNCASGWPSRRSSACRRPRCELFDAAAAVLARLQRAGRLFSVPLSVRA